MAVQLKKRSRSVKEAYGRLMDRTDAKFRDLAKELADNSIDPNEWHTQFDQLLYELHRDAHAYGRKLADASAASSIDFDGVAARIAVNLESGWMQGFLSDLHTQDPRYYDEDGNLQVDPVQERMRWYAQKSRGTANEAFVSYSPDETEWEWVDTGGPFECDDCRYLAEGSPYTKHTLPTHPGQNDTPCLFHCECHLKRLSDDETGFMPHAFSPLDAAA